MPDDGPIPRGGFRRTPAPWNAFAVLALFFGILMTLITPPFQAPDEPAHFYRAYVAASGGRAQKIDHHWGGWIPFSFHQLAAEVVDLPFHPERKIRLQKWRDLFHIPLNPAQVIFVPFPNTAMYTNASYLPQAAGLWVGLRLKLPPAALMYLGRIFNLCFWILAIGAALRTIPIGKWSLFLIALMPMTLFLAASLSADTTATAYGFLFIALVLRSQSEGFAAGWAWMSLVFVLGILIVLSKQVYFPLIFLGLTVPRSVFRTVSQYTWGLAVFLAGCGTVAVARTVVLQQRYLPYLSGGNTTESPDSQAGILHIGMVVLKTLVHETPGYVRSFVGLLGWVDTPLPKALVLGYLVLLVGISLLAIHNGVKLSPANRLTMLGIAGVNVFLIVLAIWQLAQAYGLRSPLDDQVVKGVQGRYFIPFSPLFFLALGFFPVNLARKHIDRILLLVMAAAAGFLAAAVWILVKRYWILV